MSGIPCMVCQRATNPRPCKYCYNVSICVRCYNMTHKHTQTHKYNLFKAVGSYTEPLD